MFIPVTFFWACFDQQFTTWVFQATHMDGGIFGSDSRVAFPPAYMAILNSVFILIFIPLFNKVVYPGLGEAIFEITPTNDIPLCDIDFRFFFQKLCSLCSFLQIFHK